MNMTRESQEHDDCMEVPLEVHVSVPGYPLIENLEGFAISLSGEAELDIVGYIDAHGDHVELSANEQDGFRKAAYAALMREASKPWVKHEFEDGFYQHFAGKRVAAQERAHNFRVVA